MKLKKSKKGFTLTELAIVIAVIAVLIAVLVPTFVSLINKANNSSDEQTVKNMNTALQIDEADNDKPEYLCQVWEILENAGYNPAPTPNYSDNQFYWYKTDNVILIYSTNEEQFTFPSDYAGTNLSTASTVVNVASTTVTAAKTAITSWTNLVKLDTDADSDDAHNFGGETTTIVSETEKTVSKKCSACDNEFTETVISDGSTTPYNLLSSSANLSGSYILNEDIALSAMSLSGSTIIDLNGNTLTVAGSITSSLTLTGEGEVVLSGGITNSSTVTTNGTITINLNNYEFASSAAIINKGTLTITDDSVSKGGIISNSTGNGSSEQEAAIQNYGTLIVSGGSITAATGSANSEGIRIESGSVTIIGGTISGGVAIDMGGGSLSISGGTVTSTSTATEGYKMAVSALAGSSVSISGGTFNGCVYIDNTISNYSSAITGGNFSINYAYTTTLPLSNYISTGYTLSSLSAVVDNYYTVTENS